MLLTQPSYTKKRASYNLKSDTFQIACDFTFRDFKGYLTLSFCNRVRIKRFPSHINRSHE